MLKQSPCPSAVLRVSPLAALAVAEVIDCYVVGDCLILVTTFHCIVSKIIYTNLSL